MVFVMDNGKYNSKYILDNKRYIMPSKIEKGISTFSEETIFYNGESYIVGEEAENYDYSFTKNNIHHKIILYYCLSKHAKKSYQEYDVITGCPLSTYLNKEEQYKYIQNIMNDNKPIKVIYKDRPITFKINSVIIAPENIGGYINDFHISKNQIRGVVDIGGLNVNCGIYDKGKPVKNKMFTLNLGMHILIKNIQQALLRNSETMINEYMCEHMLNNIENIDVKSRNVIEEECNNFILSIKNQLIKNDWELNQLNLRFIGGGSILLKKYINKHFENPHINEDIFANCEAFLKFGAKKIAKK